MHRVDTTGNVANMFDAGNPGLGLPPTQIGEDWLNDVQENLVHVILTAGIALTKGRKQDLYDAIAALIVLLAPSAGYSTTVVAGLIRLATQADVDGGSVADEAVTPATLRASTATTTRPGVSRFATTAEVIAGLLTNVAIDPAGLAALTALTTRAGIQANATGAEVLALSASNKTVTPNALNSLDASTTQKGLQENATGAEVQALSSATLTVTPNALNSLDASTSQKGLQANATTAQANALSSTSLTMTPGSLGAMTPSTTQRAISRAATVAEGRAGAATDIYASPAAMAAAIQGGTLTYAADSNAAANALTVTLTPAPAAYTAGMLVWVKANGANTGSVTVNVNALGNKTVKRNGAALAGGEILDGQIVCLAYDGTDFQLIGGVTEIGSFNATGGWFKLNSGIIVQIGTVTATSTGSGTAGEATWTYPVTFPNACFWVWPTVDQGVAGCIGGGNIVAYCRSAGFSSAIIGIDDGSASTASFQTHCIAFGY